MIDLQNNDATHGDETYQDQFTTSAFNDAKEQIFNSLSIMVMRILRRSLLMRSFKMRAFWSAVFNIGCRMKV